ncbi:MAG: hypothetical protein KBT30_01875, partial [Clostridiales bacterium]|nr:hypothetical protein [Candidatus Apopatousia equi]
VNTFTKQDFTSYSGYIFAGNQKGQPYLPINMKCYYCKLWDNDIMVRDYVPVVLNRTLTQGGNTYEAGTAGLFDLVNQTFYANNGTETFAVGNLVK